MPTLLLHIGASKAGSTAIQELGIDNREELGRNGIEYFPILSRQNHAELAAAFCRRTTPVFTSVGLGEASARGAIQRRLAKGLRTRLRPDSIWLASSEHLSVQLRSKAEISECAEFLGEFFDRIVVLFVARRADYWLPSAYPQSVRDARVSGPFDAAYVESRRRMLDHRKLMGRWEKAFGAGHVRCIPLLETDKSSLLALPDRLMAAAGFGDVHIQWCKPLSRPSNPAISAPATEVLRVANPLLATSIFRPSVVRNRAVAYIAERWPGPRVRLTPSARDALEALELPAERIVDSCYAFGDDWDQWLRQDPAPVAEPFVLSTADREAALADLKAHGFIKPPREPSFLSEAAARAVQPLRAWSRQHRHGRSGG